MTSTLEISSSTSAVDQLDSHRSSTSQLDTKNHSSTVASESRVTTSSSVSSTQSVVVTETLQAVDSTSLRTVPSPLTSSSDLSLVPLDTSSIFASSLVMSTPTPEITESSRALIPSRTKSTLTSSDASGLKYTSDHISTPLYSGKAVTQSSYTKTLHQTSASLGRDRASSGIHDHWVNPVGTNYVSHTYLRTYVCNISLPHTHR